MNILSHFNFLISIFLTSLSFASAPLIINGIETPKGQFGAVVKLSIGDQYENKGVNENRGTCTGTFISSEYIITAAHCLRNYYEQKEEFEYQVITTKGDLSFSKGLDILINDERELRVLDYHITDDYREYLEAYYSLHRKQHYVESQIKNNIISLEDGESVVMKLNDEKERLHNERSDDDFALIKVTPKSTDEIYELSYDMLDVDDEVYMVGYGVNGSELKQNKVRAKLDYYMALHDETLNYLDKDKFMQVITNTLIEMESLSGIKKHGRNRVSDITERFYKIYGYSRDMKPYSVEGKKVSSKKSSGLNVSIGSGDSGGPLLKKVGDTFKVYGVAITSKGKNEWGLRSNYINISSSYVQGFLAKYLSK